MCHLPVVSQICWILRHPQPPCTSFPFPPFPSSQMGTSAARSWAVAAPGCICVASSQTRQGRSLGKGGCWISCCKLRSARKMSGDQGLHSVMLSLCHFHGCTVTLFLSAFSELGGDCLPLQCWLPHTSLSLCSISLSLLGKHLPFFTHLIAVFIAINTAECDTLL